MTKCPQCGLRHRKHPLSCEVLISHGYYLFGPLEERIGPKYEEVKNKFEEMKEYLKKFKGVQNG